MDNQPFAEDMVAVTVKTFTPAFKVACGVFAAIVLALYTGLLPALPAKVDTDPLITQRLDALERQLSERVEVVRNDVGAVAKLVALPNGSSAPATKTDVEDLRSTLAMLAARLDAANKSRPESPPKRK